jgi:hypothetical protein
MISIKFESWIVIGNISGKERRQNGKNRKGIEEWFHRRQVKRECIQKDSW